jgi:hypothetical protein
MTQRAHIIFYLIVNCLDMAMLKRTVLTFTQSSIDAETDGFDHDTFQPC